MKKAAIVLSIALVFCLFATTISSFAIEAHADNTVSAAYIQAQLDSWAPIFNNKYWNYYGGVQTGDGHYSYDKKSIAALRAAIGKDFSTCTYADLGITDYACHNTTPDKAGEVCHHSTTYSSGDNTRWSCYGFEMFISDALFGLDSYNQPWTAYTSKNYSELRELLPGDRLETSFWGHGSIIWKIEDGKVFFFECLGGHDSQCVIRCHNRFSSSSFTISSQERLLDYLKQGKIKIYRNSRVTSCDHTTRTADGYCKNPDCGQDYLDDPVYKSNAITANGEIHPNGQRIAVNVRPYAASAEINDYRFGSIPVTGTVVNHFGHTWYKVNDPKSGREGYVYCDNTGWRLYGAYYQAGAATEPTTTPASILTPADSNEPDISLDPRYMKVNVGKGSTLLFSSNVSTAKKYKIDSIPDGTMVYVYGTTRQKYDDRTWAKINYNGKDGWVNVAWLTETKETKSQILEYSITFNPNGGTGTMSEAEMVCGVPKALPKNTFRKTGDTFVGWSGSRNGPVQYSDQQVVDLSKMGGICIELFAQWEPGIKTYTVQRQEFMSGNIVDDEDIAIAATNSTMKVNVGAGSTLRFCSYVSLDNAYEIGSIPNDTVVYVYGTTTEQYEDRTWAKINYNNTDGWVNVAWLAPYETPKPALQTIDLTQYYGQWVAGRYYDDRDFYDDMLTIEPVSANEISIKWELYRIAGFRVSAAVDLTTGIAQFPINDSWTGHGYVKLENGTVTLHIVDSTFKYAPAGDEHIYLTRRPTANPQQKAVEYEMPVLSVNGNNIPNDLTVGSNFGIRGIIQTNCGIITQVKSYILDSDYNIVQSGEYAPNTTSLDLQYSVNNDLAFGRLPVGSYIYYVEATAVNGDKTVNIPLINERFSVVAPESTSASRVEPDIRAVGQDMIVDVGSDSTLRFCSTVSTADAYEIGSLPNTATVYVYGITTEQYEGRTWAKVNYNGVDGWVNYAWLSEKPHSAAPESVAQMQPAPAQYDVPVLSISENNAPSDMTIGSNFGIRGIIQTSCGTISRVQAFILDSSYNVVQTSEYTPNEASLDLRYTVNNDLIFGKLPAGSYVYNVEATAVNGDKTTSESLINVGFTVIAPAPEPQPEPPIQAIGNDMVVNVGKGSTLRFCSTVSVDDEYEIGSIPNAQTVYVYGVTTQKYENRTWARINYLGVDGWVNYDWLTNVPQAVVTPEPQPEPTPETVTYTAPTLEPQPPVIYASNDYVTIDKHVANSSDVTVYCDGDLPSRWYLNLAAAGPFVCDWVNDRTFTIYPTGTGIADLEIWLVDEDTEQVVAKRVIQVEVVDSGASTQIDTPLGNTRNVPEESATQPTPIPQPDLPGYRLATKLDTNYVLDIAGHGVSNGDNLQISRNNNSSSQGFDLTDIGGGYWRITNSNSGLDLTAEGAGTSGSNVYQWEYTGSDTQIWYFVENPDGSYLIANKASGCYLDVNNAWANDGNNVGMFVRNDGYDAQNWFIQAAYLA